MNQKWMLACRAVFWIAITTIGLSSSIAQGEILSYELLPGSTITPYLGADPIGPTEPLSGTFQWIGPDINSGFNAVALSFASPSFTLTLNETALNNVETSVLSNPSRTYFSEIADLTGLSLSVGWIDPFVVGSYLGPASKPTFLDYPDLVIGPPNGGGLYIAHLNFTAALVPEPSTLVLAAMALAAILVVRKAA